MLIARFLCTLIFSESIWMKMKTVLVDQNEAVIILLYFFNFVA